jgi:hypothetical protein
MFTDGCHLPNVQLDGYCIMLTIQNLKESDFNVIYRLQLSYGVNQTVQYTVLLESASKYVYIEDKYKKYQQHINISFKFCMVSIIQ